MPNQKHMSLEDRNYIEQALNQNMSFKEIGQILGKTETWARVTFYRGKQKVKERDCYGE